MPHNGTQVVDGSTSTPAAEMVAQGFLVTYRLNVVESVNTPRCGGGKRGKVSGFSRESRWRLLKNLAVVQWGKARLITLTYPADFSHDVLAKSDKHLKAFVERWVRHYKYRPSFVWRKEYTARGIVHYHLLQPKPLWHDDLIKFVSRSWAEILATDRFHDIERVGTKVEFCKSPAQSMSYVAKYIAKASESFPAYHRGRVWGIIGRGNFHYADKHIHPIPIAKFFEVKDDLESRLGHHVYAQRIDMLKKWW